MAKAPSFQFYPGDWRRDTQVQMASMATRGVWFEMLCCMWDAPERGKLEGSVENIARLVGCSVEDFKTALDEIVALKIADFEQAVTERHGIITVLNRRMVREEKERNNSKKRSADYRERKSSRPRHGDITPPSSTSSSTLCTKVHNNGDSDPSKKRKPKSKKRGSFVFVLPDWIPEETWNQFAAMRDTIKKPLTPYASHLICLELAKIKQTHNHDPVAVLNKSITSSWQDVYPLKSSGGNGNGNGAAANTNNPWAVCPRCHKEVDKAMLEGKGCLHCQ